MANNTAKILTPKLNPLASSLKEDKVQANVNLAFEQFRDKSHAEKERGFFNFTRLALMVFHAFSIGFAFLFIFSFVLQMISGYSVQEVSFEGYSFTGGIKEAVSLVISAVLTLCILLIIEAGKTLLGKIVADTKLKEGRFLWAFGIVFVMIIAGSVFSSVEGSLVLAKYQNRVDPNSVVNTDSINQRYFSIIEEEKASIAALKNDPKNLVLDHGKRVLGWNIRETIKRKEARISEIWASMEKDKGRADETNGKLEIESVVNTSFYRKTAGIFSAIIELLIVMSIFYQRSYLFKTYKETQLGINSLSPTLSAKIPNQTGTNNQGGGAKKMPGQSTTGMPGPADSFSMLVNEINPAEADGANDLAFLTKYEQVVRDHFAGMSIKNLSQKHGISEGTVKNIRRTIKKHVVTSN